MSPPLLSFQISCKIYSLWFLKMDSPSYAFFSQTLKLIASKVRRLPLYIQSCKQCYRHTTENLTLLYSVYTSTAAAHHRLSSQTTFSFTCQCLWQLYTHLSIFQQFAILIIIIMSFYHIIHIIIAATSFIFAFYTICSVVSFLSFTPTQPASQQSGNFLTNISFVNFCK